jgi:hypothetical protein
MFSRVHGSGSWPAARGPGRPGLLRGCQGGLDCLASPRVRGQGAGRAWYLVEMNPG